MRLHGLLRTACAGTLATAVLANTFTPVYIRQHASSASSLPSSLPALTSSSSAASSSTASSAGSSSASSSPTLTVASSTASVASSITSTSPPPTSQAAQSSHPPTSSAALTTSTRPSSTTAAPATTSTASNAETLPLNPTITPALSIGGVILIITGGVQALMGIKHRWVHTFLSCNYLCSLSITVLIDYLMGVPVANGIQGAYLVGIVVPGMIFGGVCLAFQEVTEGLGCLLGGFCLAMWFLTLAPGGIIHDAAGRGILIGVFCAVCWATSFPPYTRSYGLIASTAISGATAVVLGADCFTRAGYKEFWLYVWDLNPNLFPLNTTTYPLTRGMRVEIIVIVLASLMGIVSQIKLWKVIRDRRREKEEERRAEELRRDAVDAALGRQLERQTSQARVQWEKIYGENGAASRISIVESTIGTEDMLGRVPMSQRRPGSVYEPTDVEMRRIGVRRSATWDPATKRQTMVTILPIPEGDEPAEQSAVEDRRHSAGARGDSRDSAPGDRTSDVRLSTDPPTENETLPTEVSGHPSVADVEESHERLGKRSSRQSMQSVWKRMSGQQAQQPPCSQSQESLMIPSVHHSRASSLAATVDGEQEIMDMAALGPISTHMSRPPDIIVSSGDKTGDRLAPPSPRLPSVPPSPPALSVNFVDPEELPWEASVVPTSTQQGPDAASRAASRAAESMSEDTAKQELLTSTALESVPNHVSNVVLTYRTHEWAKHADKAEAPVFEEPANMEIEMPDEAPAQVLDSIIQSERIPEVVPQAAAEPPVPSRTPSASARSSRYLEPVATSSNAVVQRTLSQQMRANMSTGDVSTSHASQLNIPRGFRSTSTPMLHHSVVTSPIDENAEMNFPPSPHSPVSPPLPAMISPSTQRATLVPRPSTADARSGLSTPRRPVSASATRPGSSAGVHTLAEAIQRAQSRVASHGDDEVRPVSQLSNSGRPLMLADTRMSSYDSRQPVRQSSAPDAGRRETLLADWRTSIRHDVTGTVTPAISIEESRAAMLMNKTLSQQTEQQERQAKEYSQQIMDQAMRRPDVQELHREALRKMQARANKHVQ